jgi:hypothetical protein
MILLKSGVFTETIPRSVETSLLSDEMTALQEGTFALREGTSLIPEGPPPLPEATMAELEAPLLPPEGTEAEFYPRGHHLEATFAKKRPRRAEMKG